MKTTKAQQAGARLKLLREHHVKANQGDFLKEVSQASIAMLENGKRLPTSEHLVAMYEQHRINPNYVLLGLPPLFIDKKATNILPELEKAAQAIKKAQNIINAIQ